MGKHFLTVGGVMPLFMIYFLRFIEQNEDIRIVWLADVDLGLK
jgi:hypothetical protein